jgi:ribosomal protein S12 methylthiotransferase
VLVDSTGIARSAGEAPEIDGIVHVGHDVPVGDFATVEIADALGPDLVAVGATAGESDADGR